MRRKPRHLSKDEAALWSKVAARTQPLRPSGELLSTPQDVSVDPPLRKKDAPAFSPTPDPIDRPILPSAVQMDAKSHRQMRRGKLKPEARIDLHGMTLSEAHPALINFVMSAHAEGKRLVLVITGKGRSLAETPFLDQPRGILRRQVPQWLRLVPLAPVVMDVTPAHIKHGGDGALYVYLRRRRGVVL